MTPHRINGRGTFRIDRTIPPVGRLAVASGTKDPAEFEAIKGPGGLLDVLRRLERYELLRDIRDGRQRAIDILRSYQAGGLDRLPTGGAHDELRDRLTRWLEVIPNLDTRRGYRGALRLAGGLRAGIPVHELSELLRRYRGDCQRRGVWRVFNLARSAAQSFLRDEFGGRHPLYQAVDDLRPLPRTTKAKRPPAWSHADLNALCDQLPTDAAAIARGMAYTGMNPKEYWGTWHVLADRIHIDGTKRQGRDRDVPFLVPVVRPAITRRTFRRRLEKIEAPISSKTFRNFFARWCDEAGIPTMRRESYMGHGIRSMADLYPAAEVDGFLVSDGEKLRAHLSLVTRNLLRIERAG